MVAPGVRWKASVDRRPGMEPGRDTKAGAREVQPSATPRLAGEGASIVGGEMTMGGGDGCIGWAMVGTGGRGGSGSPWPTCSGDEPFFPRTILSRRRRWSRQPAPYPVISCAEGLPRGEAKCGRGTDSCGDWAGLGSRDAGCGMWCTSPAICWSEAAGTRVPLLMIRCTVWSNSEIHAGGTGIHSCSRGRPSKMTIRGDSHRTVWLTMRKKTVSFCSCFRSRLSPTTERDESLVHTPPPLPLTSLLLAPGASIRTRLAETRMPSDWHAGQNLCLKCGPLTSNVLSQRQSLPVSFPPQQEPG
mmetsp:Transcript_23256/g.75338  ORF Transcript_23256/g.75338 Transcript_23256/m.75338 type:complete len:301 (+) Transcript_23256:1102-2004(+)